MIDADKKIRIRPDIRYRSIADEGIVLRQDAGEVLVVNGVGIRIVELIAAGSTETEIVAVLEREFDVPADQLRADVRAYLDELSRAGVLDETD